MTKEKEIKSVKQEAVCFPSFGSNLVGRRCQPHPQMIEEEQEIAELDRLQKYLMFIYQEYIYFNTDRKRQRICMFLKMNKTIYIYKDRSRFTLSAVPHKLLLSQSVKRCFLVLAGIILMMNIDPESSFQKDITIKEWGLHVWMHEEGASCLFIRNIRWQMSAAEK